MKFQYIIKISIRKPAIFLCMICIRITSFIGNLVKFQNGRICNLGQGPDSTRFQNFLFNENEGAPFGGVKLAFRNSISSTII